MNTHKLIGENCVCPHCDERGRAKMFFDQSGGYVGVLCHCKQIYKAQIVSTEPLRINVSELSFTR